MPRSVVFQIQVFFLDSPATIYSSEPSMRSFQVLLLHLVGETRWNVYSMLPSSFLFIVKWYSVRDMLQCVYPFSCGWSFLLLAIFAYY